MIISSTKRSKEGGRDSLICGDGGYLRTSLHCWLPPFILFLSLGNRPTAHLIWPKTKTKKTKQNKRRKRKKKRFRLKSRLLYCNGPPFPHADASSPSLVRHALHKLCFPNRLPAASDSCQACSMLSSTDTRLAQPYLHACPASDRSFHYHGNDSTVFSPVTRFIYRGAVQLLRADQ